MRFCKGSAKVSSIFLLKTATKSTQFFPSVKREKVRKKGQNCICPLFELKELLCCKCILATFLQNIAQYLKIFVLGKVPNFVLLVPPVVWFTMVLQTGHLEDSSMRELFYYYYLLWSFFYFFRINFPKKSIVLRFGIRKCGDI